ncbi:MULTISPECIES: chromate efflux transporter [unclassified Aureimonas]|uniref:chromate efflux transporter n=1 Tax=unclassified Aureimonas TaxID=2615206 RepID=UPI0006FA8E97|nr:MULTISPECIES: chromate efflux transporter [unclassified Aureimonas]KQT62043.1 chromate transporter [Aureimonas sp. Leaf460]KQT69574.1 chromate transporter [Aureimonas sp. Leaf427]
MASDAGPSAPDKGEETTERGTPFEVFCAFLVLGLTSFGGPVAHLGYFREAFVVRRRWISDAAYADLVALCQFLPGPASSQVGMALGLRRAGGLGMLAAWTAFTLPSALILVGFALGASVFGGAGGAWVEGVKAAAVAVVAQAVLGMARTLAIGRERATISGAALILALLLPGAGGQVLAILLGGLAGLALLQPPVPTASVEETLHGPVRRGAAIGALALFAVLLVALPLLAALTGAGWAVLADGFYRSGSLVFGGGHVVLPLLQSEFVETGHIGREAFLAGYGVTQAMPGPLFTFAAYVGAASNLDPNGLAGAALALVAIFLPSALLVLGVLPFWQSLRASPSARRALSGINAAVVGLLAAALYDPVFSEGVTSAPTMAIAVASFVGLVAWSLPAWAVVAASALLGAVFL